MAIHPRQRNHNKRTIIGMLETTPATVAREIRPSLPAEPVPDLDFDWRPQPLDRAIGTRRSFRWSILMAAAVLSGLALVAVQVLVTVPQQRADARRIEYRAALDAYEPALTAYAAAAAPSDPAALAAFSDATNAFAAVARAGLPTVIPLLPVGPIEELRPARSEMLAMVDTAETILADLAAAAAYRRAAAEILALPFLPTEAPVELIDPAARAIADMESATEMAVAALDDDPLFTAYRQRVGEAVDALPDWANRYLLALHQGDVEATTTLVVEFRARSALATAELEAAVGDVDRAAAALIPDLQTGLEQARIKLG